MADIYSALTYQALCLCVFIYACMYTYTHMSVYICTHMHVFLSGPLEQLSFELRRSTHMDFSTTYV